MPLYLQVKQVLEDRIRYGHYPLGTRLPGERELAEELQLSPMTVGKAVMALADSGRVYRQRGKGTFVKDLRFVASSRAVNIGLVVNIPASLAMKDFYLGDLFQGIHRAIADTSNRTATYMVTSDLESRLVDTDMDGFIFIGVPDRFVPAIQRLSDAGKRVLTLGAKWENSKVPFVDSDNHAGAQMAVEHLIGLGHRQIAGVFAQQSVSNTIDRIAGFRATMQAHGLPVSPDALIVDDHVMSAERTACSLSSEGLTQLKTLLQGARRPTAIFCGGYYIALDVMQAIADLGLSIPQDVSVVGFDDPVSAAHLMPALTTIRQPLDLMASNVIAMLMEWLQSGIEPHKGELIPTTLIVRDSTAQLKD